MTVPKFFTHYDLTGTGTALPCLSPFETFSLSDKPRVPLVFA